MDSPDTRGVPSKRYREWLASQHPPVAKAPREYKPRPGIIYSWDGMLGRCTDPEHADYEFYGARGITVEWATRAEFERDMGPKPHRNVGVRRRDTSLGFTPRNCYWGTGKEIV